MGARAGARVRAAAAQARETLGPLGAPRVQRVQQLRKRGRQRRLRGQLQQFQRQAEPQGRAAVRGGVKVRAPGVRADLEPHLRGGGAPWLSFGQYNGRVG